MKTETRKPKTVFLHLLRWCVQTEDAPLLDASLSDHLSMLDMFCALGGKEVKVALTEGNAGGLVTTGYRHAAGFEPLGLRRSRRVASVGALLKGAVEADAAANIPAGTALIHAPLFAGVPAEEEGLGDALDRYVAHVQGAGGRILFTDHRLWPVYFEHLFDLVAKAAR